MKIGIIGCGNISGQYLDGAKKTDALDVKAIADVNMDAARAQGARFGVPAVTVDDLLADKEIELIVNLTIPAAHVEVGLRILDAGKHAYSEKPFGINSDNATELIKKSRATGLRVGCAPDTFLGAGVQTARKVLDDGKIGRPIAGMAFMTGHGPEPWHPNPKFFYEVGGGPMLDMGPYYVTALVNLLGSVKRVAAITTKGFEERVAGHESIRGTKFPVTITTHLAGTLEFVNGAVITMIMSFDVWRATTPRIEIFGADGTLSVPDPNTFGGPVAVSDHGGDWQQVALTHPNNARMIGVVDMVQAIKSGRKHRASGDLAYHVLEVMTSFDKSSESGQHVAIKSAVERPAALPLGLKEWQVD